MARSSPLSLKAWDGVNQCEGLLRIVTIGSGQLRREEPRDRRRLDGVCCPAWPGRWDSVPSAAPKNCPDRAAVYNCLGPINLSVACLQSSKEKWISCQMPDCCACCQSRNRRQQVMPEPHPSSCGSIPRGIPLRRTNRIPVRQAQSGKRACLPWVHAMWAAAAVESDSTKHQEAKGCS